ncbi:HU family DNA-binding protein [Candidatus Acetothermia bacterium]|nr:HU family DNA-binding protein [Candidatus Acetothermia bacterium]
MNRAELAELIFKKAKLPTKVAAKRALEVALQAIMESVAKGEPVTLTGFGTFKPAMRKAARRFNPQTRQPIDVPAKKVARFKAGKDFKQRVAKGK